MGSVCDKCGELLESILHTHYGCFAEVVATVNESNKRSIDGVILP